MREFAIGGRSLDVTALASAAWRWWTSELLAMVPAPVASALRGSRTVLVFDLLERELVLRRFTGQQSTELGRVERQHPENVRLPPEIVGSRDGTEVVVRLSPQEVLRRIVVLPLAARRDLRRILEFELERQSPIAPDHVEFDCSVKRRDRRANKLEVELRIVRRETLDEAIALCRTIGLEPTRVVAAADAGGMEEGGFARSRTRPLRRWLRRPAIVGLGGTALVLGVALATAHVLRQEALAGTLELEVSKARTAAREADALARQMHEAQERAGFLARQKQAPLLSSALAEVSRLLPDGTWVFEFEMRGRDVRLHGYSPQASSLISLIDNAPMFGNAHFRSPLTRGSGKDVDRFDLSFEMKEARP